MQSVPPNYWLKGFIYTWMLWCFLSLMAGFAMLCFCFEHMANMRESKRQIYWGKTGKDFLKRICCFYVFFFFLPSFLLSVYQSHCVTTVWFGLTELAFKVLLGGRRRRERQRMRWLDGTTDSIRLVWVNSGSWWWTGRPGVLRFMGSQRVGHDWATELNWTELLAPADPQWVSFKDYFLRIWEDFQIQQMYEFDKFCATWLKKFWEVERNCC